MDRDERWYFLERARCSLEAGEKAEDPAIAAIHLDLYQRYLDLANQPVEDRLQLRVVPRASN